MKKDYLFEEYVLAFLKTINDIYHELENIPYSTDKEKSLMYLIRIHDLCSAVIKDLYKRKD